jgi:hypothetical protein
MGRKAGSVQLNTVVCGIQTSTNHDEFVQTCSAARSWVVAVALWQHCYRRSAQQDSLPRQGIDMGQRAWRAGTTCTTTQQLKILAVLNWVCTDFVHDAPCGSKKQQSAAKLTVHSVQQVLHTMI